MILSRIFSKYANAAGWGYLLVGLISAVLTSCGNDLKELESTAIENPIPSAVYKDYNITYNDSGLTQVKMTGITLLQFNSVKGSEAYDRMKDSVHLWFFDENKVTKSELIADEAIRNRATGYMEAMGNVVVYNEKGEKLNTEHLIWDEKNKQIISNVDVMITKENQIIKGKGLVSDQSFLDYEIKNVTGVINVKKSARPKKDDH